MGWEYLPMILNRMDAGAEPTYGIFCDYMLAGTPNSCLDQILIIFKLTSFNETAVKVNNKSYYITMLVNIMKAITCIVIE